MGRLRAGGLPPAAAKKAAEEAAAAEKAAREEAARVAAEEKARPLPGASPTEMACGVHGVEGQQ